MKWENLHFIHQNMVISPAHHVSLFIFTTNPVVSNLFSSDYTLCIAYKKKGYVVLSWNYVWSRGQENAMPCHCHATGVNVLSKMFPSFSTSKWSWLSKESAGLGLNERVLFCVFLIASRKFISLFLQTEEFGWML